MCGRFVEYTEPKIIKKAFDINRISKKAQAYRPSYNIVPGDEVLTIVSQKNDEQQKATQKNDRVLTTFRWGLIPFWAKDEKIGYRMINARVETLTTKASFRRPFQKQRCLIVADGFYEWQKTDQKKQPFYVRLKTDQPIVFAGLYDVWRPTKQMFSGQKSNQLYSAPSVIYSCTIITMPANKLLQPIHDRMPVIIERREDQNLWLSNQLSDQSSLQDILTALKENNLQSYRVNNQVNSPLINSPENIVAIK